MTDEPVQVIVAVFQSEQGADTLLYELEAAQLSGYIGIQNAAILRRDQENKLHIREKGDWGPGQGAAAGAVLGALVGAIAGPGAIVVGAAGAVIGSLAAKLRDSGFEDDRLQRLGDSLTPGTSALVVVVEHKWLADTETRIAEAGGDLVTQEDAAKLAEWLALDGEVTYTVVGTEESTVTDEVPITEEKA
jgi:uncharacterized membrane protein